MPEVAIGQKINSIMKRSYRIPSITAYNRLEPNPRSPNFDRSLKAEIRDPLWILTRQWQFGEFQGEDAGSPIMAQILGRHSKMSSIGFPSGKVLNYDESIPIETTVEGEESPHTLFLAVQIARYFIKLMKKYSVERHLTKFSKKYKLTFDIERNDYEGQQMLQAVEGTFFNGYNMYQDMITMDHSEMQTCFTRWINAFDNNDIPTADKVKLSDLSKMLIEWFRRNYSQPESALYSAWLPTQLEYKFAVSSLNNQDVLVADQYCGGHLDWFSFDLDSRNQLLLPKSNPELDGSVSENLASFIPSPVAFKGMPNSRFWAMEESQTDFGKIDTSTTGLLHLLYAEFGLIYSNDWFMLPYPLGINTLCEIPGIIITDVFGFHFFIRPAGEGPDCNWHRWAMFRHTERSNPAAISNSFYLAPSLTKVYEGKPLEKIEFLRDEMDNMVWAVENIVPSQAGIGVRGNEMASRDVALYSVRKTVTEDEPKIRYVLGTTVPDNWIPFVAVHLKDNMTEIRLQRARMPASKGPFGVLLTEKEPPYFVNEEEVPRAGVNVQRGFQRTRWLNGKTYLWIGRYKEAGKGEGWSNLAFDQIAEI